VRADLRSPSESNDEEVDMHDDDKSVPHTGDSRSAADKLEAEKTDAEKIKADGIDEENADRR